MASLPPRLEKKSVSPSGVLELESTSRSRVVRSTTSSRLVAVLTSRVKRAPSSVSSVRWRNPKLLISSLGAVIRSSSGSENTS